MEHLDYNLCYVFSGLAAINYNNYWCRPNYNELDKSHDNIITVHISLIILLSMNGSGVDGLPCPVLLLTLWCSKPVYSMATFQQMN